MQNLDVRYYGRAAHAAAAPWMGANALDAPMSIYEVHLGSWRKNHGGETQWMNYRELAHQLVDYTYGRPVGEARQEVGGVVTTLSALCSAQGIDMHDAAEAELARIWTKIDVIRAKQAAKPKHSPLPMAGGES